MIIGRFVLLVICMITYASTVHVAVKNKTTYCIVLDSKISGTINYENKENKTVTYDFVVNDTSAKAEGNCYAVMSSASVEYADIFFFPNNLISNLSTSHMWSMRLTFKAQDSTAPPVKSFVIDDYELKAVFYPVFNATEDMVTYKKATNASLEWSGEKKRGFACSKTELPLTHDSKLIFNELNVIAFAMFENDTFSSDQIFEHCQLDMRTSDLVPIIVGACLAGLVIIVLIAYIIGRARAKRQGYASV